MIFWCECNNTKKISMILRWSRLKVKQKQEESTNKVLNRFRCFCLSLPSLAFSVSFISIFFQSTAELFKESYIAAALFTFFRRISRSKILSPIQYVALKHQIQWNNGKRWYWRSFPFLRRLNACTSTSKRLFRRKVGHILLGNKNAYLQVKKNRQRERKLVLMLSISGSVFAAPNFAANFYYYY